MTRGILHTSTQSDHFWSFYATFHDMIEIIEIPILSHFLSILLYHEMRYLSRGNIGYKLTIFTRYHNKASTAENTKKNRTNWKRSWYPSPKEWFDYWKCRSHAWPRPFSAVVSPKFVPLSIVKSFKGSAARE